MAESSLTVKTSQNNSTSKPQGNRSLQQLASSYLELCKPKVVLVMLITALVGMLLALKSTPTLNQISQILFGLIGIALCAGASAAVNHVVDQLRDQRMQRTKRRPIATGKINSKQALTFASLLVSLGSLILYQINPLCLALTLFATIGYAIIYTLILKPITPQNITIGGLAGALPPLLGWTVITPTISAEALLLVLIIFTWTPPHFWALALYRSDDYQQAKVPMLPVTHGNHFTKLHIVLYSVLLVLSTLLPWIVQFSGIIYLIAVSWLNFHFIRLSLQLYHSDNLTLAPKLFRYSIKYLLWLFCWILIDRYMLII